MFRRRRTTECHNCGHTLGEIYNYCPRCGQENNTRDVSFRTLVKEFFDNYFSMDSRFSRSIKPFLFKPSFLTSEFVKGKRVSYANPVRLYLLLSLVFFFTLNMTNHFVNRDLPRDFSILTVDGEREGEGEGERERERERETGKKSDTLDISSPDDDFIGTVSSSINWDLVDSVRFNSSYSNRYLVDSMNLSHLSFIEYKLALQLVKLYRTDAYTFQVFLLSNLPLMMVFVVPILGLWLRLFHGRKAQFYIHHLIHSIHLHSFIYLALTIALLFVIIAPSDQIDGIILALFSIIMGIYILISFKKFYRRKWLSTMFRSFGTGFFYILSLAIFLALEVFISMILF